MIEQDIPPCLIFIDKEGRWFHKGAEMVHREIIRLFYEHMAVDSLGRHVISWGGERCYVEVEDTAFVVWRVVFQDQHQSDAARLLLFLSDDSQEALRPDTLYVGKDHVLYCRVKKGRFNARFHRPAYYQLAQYVEEEKGQFFLQLGGQRHMIPYNDH